MKHRAIFLLLISFGVMLGCGVSSNTSRVASESEEPARTAVRPETATTSNPADKSSDGQGTQESKGQEQTAEVAVPSTGDGNEKSAGGAENAASTGSTPETPTSPKPAAPKSDVVHSITFDDLNCGMQADIVFRPWMLTDRVKELDGQRVRIAGYMHPDAKQKGITEFVLLRNTECKFGPAGQADHLIQVRLDPGITTKFSTSPVEVVGVLTFKPFNGPDGNTWSIFGK